ncbi:uncharacterized protein LOC134737867 [Pongo pygmaeus]|uniref:uncharacterized protein LOC134737867 n=1 Tax=Pongo pygmaeus TaxID=9600 RepID=UPI00300D2D10
MEKASADFLPPSSRAHLQCRPPTGRRRVRGEATSKVKNQQTSTVVTFQTCRLLLEVPPHSAKPESNRDGCRLGSRDARPVGLELSWKGQGTGRNHCSRSWRRVGTSDCRKWEHRGFGEETGVERLAQLSVTSASV